VCSKIKLSAPGAGWILWATADMDRVRPNPIRSGGQHSDDVGQDHHPSRIGAVGKSDAESPRTRETEWLAHYPAKDVTSWLGNSPDVANKHDAITMQASFDRAVRNGAVIEGVTRKMESGVVNLLPPKLPRTSQDNPALDEDTKKPIKKTLQITGCVSYRLWLTCH
jgi:hypothetical protein